MILQYILKISAYPLSIGLVSLLLSTEVLAHTGHNHARYGELSGVLHSLTTHPLIFAVVGLLLVTVIALKR